MASMIYTQPEHYKVSWTRIGTEKSGGATIPLDRPFAVCAEIESLLREPFDLEISIERVTYAKMGAKP